jgi:hypothetical protein
MNKVIDSEMYWRARAQWWSDGEWIYDSQYDDGPMPSPKPGDVECYVRFEDTVDEFLEWLIEEDWIEYRNPECYADDPGAG